MNKSLKQINAEKGDLMRFESNEKDLEIIMSWIEENFDFRIIQYVIMICQKNADNLKEEIRHFQKHQAWNSATFSNFVLSKIEKDYEKNNGIHQSSWPYLTCLCRMYMDEGKSYQESNPFLKMVLDRIDKKDLPGDILDWRDANGSK